jgi:gluconolactonase
MKFSIFILMTTTVHERFAFCLSLSSNPSITAITCAINNIPIVNSMGSTIDGASVDSSGHLFAVNKTHMMNLTNPSIPPIMTAGNLSFYASSRITRTLGILVGDATGHTVWQKKGFDTQGQLFPPDAQMLQPNDMAITGDESRLYFSGMNYFADTGDLWFFDVSKAALHKVDLSESPTTLFRINGIELSPNDTELFITSAENLNGSVVDAKIIRFEIDPDSGFPINPQVAFDLYETLTEKGLDPMKAGMDPDGMRMDIKGNLFISLNAFQRVLKWNIYSDPALSSVIELQTVTFPSNLELAGKEGKDLYVIGRCSDREKACIDHFVHDTPGRAFSNLQQG